jgi:Domain of unknown function (DU1801)
MVSSKETTPAAYLASLPPERRAIVAAVRKLVRQHLPKGYVETMNWGMLSYEIPLSRYPVTYNKQPLSYVALAAQKNNYSLYLMGVACDMVLRDKLVGHYATTGRKLDMGKCCLRFKTLDELPLDIIGEIVAATPVDTMIAHYESAPRKKKA